MSPFFLVASKPCLLVDGGRMEFCLTRTWRYARLGYNCLFLILNRLSSRWETPLFCGHASSKRQLWLSERSGRGWNPLINAGNVNCRWWLISGAWNFWMVWHRGYGTATERLLARRVGKHWVGWWKKSRKTWSAILGTWRGNFRKIESWGWHRIKQRQEQKKRAPGWSSASDSYVLVEPL